jgi:hypothetical protein
MKGIYVPQSKLFVIEVEGLEVTSWTPGQPGQHIPCTQVHLILNLPSLDGQFVMRIKSRRAADALIAALIEHRDHVWPEGQ